MSESNYSGLDRLLHRLALNYPFLAEIFFDLDQQLMVKRPAENIRHEKHVFVSGLARAGTTVLMRRFYASSKYRSLTYRDMPLVLAPNLWRKLSGISRKDFEAAERAHGDDLKVNADSPESLDEVFWRVFSGGQYLKPAHLQPYTADAETRDKFLHYVNAILTAQDDDCLRYLSKNNNNILRLGSIARTFPEALILIPFRDPLQHADSLLRQHTHFSQMQQEDPFTLSYMTWLSHHEFGLDHRPFVFPGAASTSASPDQLDYWLQTWVNTYQWLLDNHPQQAHFVCYEKLCSNPACWESLAAMAGIAPDLAESDILRASSRKLDEQQASQNLLQQATGLYQRMSDLSV